MTASTAAVADLEGDLIVNASARSRLSAWTIGIALQKSELTGAAWRAVRWSAILGALISLSSLLLAVQVARSIARPINMLRANDLIWSFVVNNYLLGKDPFPFDLLYWNSDSTRMPATMHSYYLRNMYQKNLLVKPGALKIGGVSIDLRTITTPTYILSTREDHIAPWKSTYAATQIYKSKELRFVLAASGHIAGVVNPPAANKYQYWTNDNIKDVTVAEWMKGAVEHKGSWWPDWREWLGQIDPEEVPARTVGSGALPPIENAPGSYVRVRA